MKRSTNDIKKEKEAIISALESINDIANNIPPEQKHTINFKGRKSSDIAKFVLKTITPANGTVCDPFFGSNAFGIAACQANLNFYGNEYDNYTYSANEALFTKCDLQVLKSLYLKIQDICREEIMDLYATLCCGQKNYISKLHFDPEGTDGFETPEYYYPTPHRDIANNETIILSTICPICGSKRKIFEKIDEEKIIATNKLDTSRFPNHHLIENSRINITYTHDADRYDRNFSNRAKWALLKIQDTINELPECNERDVLEQALVASLTLSRICQYGSGSEYIYQVMRKQAQEKNVWELFSDKVDSFIKFKEKYSLFQYDNISAKTNKMTLENKDYRDFLTKYTNYFDVIYTDPPYTDQVPYFERSQLYRDWLHAFYDKNNKYLLTKEMLQKEIIVTNAPSRADTKSGFVQYYNDIDKMFSYFYKSLKPNGRVVMTIKLGSNKYLLTLAEYIKLARKNGFEYIAKFGVDKKDPTLRKQAAWKNTVMNEMLVFFTKLDSEDTYWFNGSINMESEVTKFVYDQLNDKASSFLSITECVSKVQQYLLKKHGLLPNSNLQDHIVKTIKDNFAIANNSLVYIDSNKLYIGEEDNTDLFAKLYDIIPVIIKKFDSPKGFTLEDLYFELTNQLFEGEGNTLEQIIDNSSHVAAIRNLLENYCTMSNDQKYLLKKYTANVQINAVDVSSMDGYDFEDLTKRLLIAKGYSDVVRIGGAGDRGIDLMAKKNGEGYIFQCKRWLGNVGGTPIQRLHSMWMQMSPVISHAFCITTSDYTNDAKRESASTNVGIITGKDLMEELNHFFPGEYYHAILDNE